MYTNIQILTVHFEYITYTFVNYTLKTRKKKELKKERKSSLQRSSKRAGGITNAQTGQRGSGQEILKEQKHLLCHICISSSNLSYTA